MDDNEDVSHIFASIFEFHGYRVTVANNAFEALAVIRNDSIDGLITDFRMPRMNGGDLIKKLRSEQANLPAILVTGFAIEATNTDTRTHIFNKPVNASVLLERMGSMLQDFETSKNLRGATE